MPAVAVPPGTGQCDLSQLVCVKVLLLGLKVVFPRALLHSHLTDAIVLPGGFHSQGTFLDRERERLLAINILARVQSVDQDRYVPVVRGGNQHNFDVFEVQQLAVVGEGLGLGRLLEGRLQNFAPDIAQRHYLHRGVFLKMRHIGPAAVARSDYAQVKPVVCSQNPGVRERRRGSNAAQNGPTAKTHCGVGLNEVFHSAISFSGRSNPGNRVSFATRKPRRFRLDYSTLGGLREWLPHPPRRKGKTFRGRMHVPRTAAARKRLTPAEHFGRLSV